MKWRLLALAVGLSAVGGSARASDHADTPYLAVDASVDLTDLFAWTTTSSGAKTLNLALTLRGRPSPQAVYTFHLEARQALDVTGLQSDVTCLFSADLQVRCWAGTKDYVEGDAHRADGLLGLEGQMRVWTGLVTDRGFANLTGLRALVAGLRSAEAMADDAGCPRLAEPDRAALIDALTFDPRDDLAGGRVFALVVALALDVVAEGRPVVGVWASVRGR